MTATLSNDQNICWAALANQISQTLPEEKNGDTYKDWLTSNASDLQNIKTLQIYKKGLKRVPPEIKDLTALKKFDLERNQLKKLSRKLGAIEGLETLILHSNQLKDLPRELGNLKHLKVLDLTLNPMSEFPQVICELTGLEKLKLHNCNISKIPKEIGNLVNLKILDIAHNNIRELPTEMGNLKKLKKLNMAGNPIPMSGIPSNLWKIESIRRPLRNMWWGNFCGHMPKVAVVAFGVWYAYQVAPVHTQYQIDQFIYQNMPNISLY